MTAVKTLAIGAAGAAALLGASAPAAAQYYPSYPGYPPSYGYPYGGPTPYGAYGNRGNEQYLVQLCTNAVNQRLNARGYGGYGGFGGYGYGGNINARVIGITDIDQREGSALRIRGDATSGYGYGNPYGGYGYPYGAGAYAQPRPDLRFSCEVDYRGYVRDVDIDRR